MGYFKEAVKGRLSVGAYRAILYRCRTSAALVNESDRDTHDEWHTDYP